jgi:hypothetical protein
VFDEAVDVAVALGGLERIEDVGAGWTQGGFDEGGGFRAQGGEVAERAQGSRQMDVEEIPRRFGMAEEFLEERVVGRDMGRDRGQESGIRGERGGSCPRSMPGARPGSGKVAVFAVRLGLAQRCGGLRHFGIAIVGGRIAIRPDRAISLQTA